MVSYLFLFVQVEFAKNIPLDANEHMNGEKASTLVACIGITSGTIPPWWRVLEFHQLKFHPGGVYWNYIRYNSTLVACIGITSGTIPPWWRVLVSHQIQFCPGDVYWNYARYNSNLVPCIGIMLGTIPPLCRVLELC